MKLIVPAGALTDLGAGHVQVTLDGGYDPPIPQSDVSGLVAALAALPQKVTVHLTGADLPTLFSAPVLAVAAPGSGKYLAITRVIREWKPGTATYAASDLLGIAYNGDTSNGAVNSGGIHSLDDTNPGIQVTSMVKDDQSTQMLPSAVIENMSLMVISDSDATVVGTPDGDAWVTIEYTVETLHP